jgi:pilus assembly protein CpaB
MRNLRPLWMMVLSLGIGLSAMTVAAQWLRERGVQQTRTVLVAARDLGAGTRLDASMFETVHWPSDAPLPPTLSQVSEAEGRVLGSALLRGEPVLQAKLAGEGAAAGLAGVLHEGQRAVTVKVNEIMGVAGFALPGSHVDVMVNTTDPQNQPISKIVLERIQVLAVAQSTAQPDNKPRPVDAVTLRVSTAQAERLDLARSVGTLSLVLRNPSDSVPVQTLGVRKQDMLLAQAPTPAAAPTPASAVRPRRTSPGSAPGEAFHPEVLRGVKASPQ